MTDEQRRMVYVFWASGTWQAALVRVLGLWCIGSFASVLMCVTYQDDTVLCTRAFSTTCEAADCMECTLQAGRDAVPTKDTP